jgi:hypothetical protein
MNNLSKFPFFLILIMFTSSAFSKEIFLDCLLNFNIHEIDIDLDKRSGKWVPYTSKTFTENANDPQFRLSISSNKVRFGKRPSDYIEIDLITLKAKAVILTGLKDDSLGGGLEDDFSLGGGLEDDSLGGGLEDDSLGGGLEDDSLGGGLEDDSLGGGLEDDSLGGGLEDDFSLGGGLEDDSLGGGLEDDSLGGGLEDDSLTAGFQDGICEKVPQRLSL